MSSRGARSGVVRVVAPVCAAGVAAIAAAVAALVTAPPSAATLAGVAALLVASTLAERFPVPIEGVDARGISLHFVFANATILLFGWEAGVIVAFAPPTIMHLLDHRPPLRVAYNAAVFALSAAAAGLALAPLDVAGTDGLVARVGACAAAYYLANMLLVSAVQAQGNERSFGSLIKFNLRWTSLPFALMASLSLLTVVLWERSPFLTAALVGPVVAVSLYQRSTYRAMKAMQLALTDPLTGLGNHRHFQERLQRELLDASERGTPLTLCLLDIDDFKLRVNDRFGHPAGDRILRQVATRLRQGGEAFRLGGEEFAVLLPSHDADAGAAVATAIVERMAAQPFDHNLSITVSAGVATFPSQGVGRDELIRLADSALYWAKEHGKNQVRVYRPDVVELAELKRLAAGPDRAARYRAAASLARAVDARDAYTGSHSERVAELAARIASRVGCDAEMVELTRLAASLHDLGKLAVPEEILRKPGPLTGAERLVLERHPQIGYRMLESLGVDPLADWVLHHHERWDGAGYPDGLAREEIPLGARIIFVADAFDAMTSDRVYRASRSDEEALAELARCAGTQFDPELVAAFAAELGATPPRPLAVAS